MKLSRPRWRGAFRSLTRLLSPANPSRRGHPPPDALAGWDWPAILRVASDLRLASTLHWRLADHGWLPLMPDAVRDWTEGAAELGRMRAEAQREEALVLTRLMAAAGIKTVLLKGTAALFDGLYPDPGARYSGDIDVLVPADRLDAAQALLRAQGFAPIQAPYAMTARAKHLPRLAHPDRRFGIELHQNVVEPAFQLALPPTAMLERAIPAQDSAAVWLPSPEDRLAHCLAHLMDDRRQSPVPLLRQMLELRLLAERTPPDWATITARFAAAGVRGELMDTLATAEALVGLAWPPALRRPRYGLAWRWRLWQQLHVPGLARATRLATLAAPLLRPRRLGGLLRRAATSGDIRAFIGPRLRDLRDRTDPRA
ncbi:nucleotidyltransferase family protein [Nitrospirillum iridis]|uniref:Nucleotidyltransferase family protein n=1 Tax=Nitrospirillum iridis TaxID=765888 RepID=A0A7X0EAK4_9PROT|nr:hypothetical protein [Nitrospirillum iridis]